MNHIIVYIDDADYAGQVLSGTLGAPAEDMHWTLVACAPRHDPAREQVGESWFA